jgi:hypothetical protein
MAKKDKNKKLLEEANGMGQDPGNYMSAGKSFMSNVLGKMPYTYKIVEEIPFLNPKFEKFSKLAADPSSRPSTKG